MTATPQGERFMDLRYRGCLCTGTRPASSGTRSRGRAETKPEILNKARGRTCSPRVCVPRPCDTSTAISTPAISTPPRSCKAPQVGHRIIYLTTKHHDGFAMFDTTQSDYKVTAPDCPAGANLQRANWPMPAAR